MDIFDNFSVRDVKTCISLIDVMVSNYDGVLKSKDLRNKLEILFAKYTETRINTNTSVDPLPVLNAVTHRKALPICPTCNLPMFPAKNNEGLNIFGCRKCRYSKIL